MENAGFQAEKRDFHRKTANYGPKTAFSDPFSPARPVAARFRSENRLTPRRQVAKKLLKGRTPLGVFAPLCEKYSGIGRPESQLQWVTIRKPPHTKTPSREGASELPHAAWRSLCLCVRISLGNAGFQAENRDFSSKNGLKRPENGLFGPFFACAARCGSFPLTIFCPKRSLRPAKREFYAGRRDVRRGSACRGNRAVEILFCEKAAHIS